MLLIPRNSFCPTTVYVHLHFEVFELCAHSNCEQQSVFTVTLIPQCLTLVVIGSLQCVAGQSASGDANMEDRQAKVK